MNNLTQVLEPLELIAPLPIEWEITPEINERPFCNVGYKCEIGSSRE